MASQIRSFLWFDTQAEDAARFYTGIFKESKLGAIARFPEAGQEITGKPPGSATRNRRRRFQRLLAPVTRRHRRAPGGPVAPVEDF